MRLRLRSVTLALSLMALPMAATAYQLPAVNLGATSFYDGMPGGDSPGLYLNEYLQYMPSDRLAGPHGHKQFPGKQHVTMFVPLTQFIYIFPTTWWGHVHPGLTALVPIAHSHVNVSADRNFKGQGGLGDTSVGGILQFDPIMDKNGRPVFSQRIEAEFILPTGKYKNSTNVNPGAHAWAFNPYYAFTWFMTPRWSMSSRIWYLWNAKNHDPSAQFDGAHTTQAGQAIHFNLASAYRLNDKWSVGLNGYYLRQFTDTKVDGHDVSGLRERVWAVGPGVKYTFDKDNAITVNGYKEFGAHNRATGNRLIVQLSHYFR